jgi:hypothetical protein
MKDLSGKTSYHFNAEGRAMHDKADDWLMHLAIGVC